MTLEERLQQVKSSLPDYVTLVAVSKTHPAEAILSAYRAGQLDFGENRVQELVPKQDELPKDIRWHLIGHLQQNKVKQIAPFVYLIHSVDSEDLLKVISKEALKNNRKINCLIQVHIAQEEHKFGFTSEAAFELLSRFSEDLYPGVIIQGLMGMATFSDDQSLIQSEFKILKSLFDRIQGLNLPELIDFKVLSMGMSGDAQLAIAQGSTMVRIGSAIFGSR